jgi:MFS family permease
MQEKKTSIPFYSWYALALLTVIYVLNFVDRVLIYILFQPIKQELHFTDLQLAVLGSTSFVIFYTFLGIPLGRLSDKHSRKRLIAIGLALWSLFAGLTGFAHDFWSLFFCRMMVGVGEATFGPAALSLLSDYFPARLRATAQSIFSSAITIGSGIAFFFGGLISDAYTWRHAFYFLGFPGIAFVVLILLLKEPERGIQDKKEAGANGPAPKSDWRKLIANAPLRYLLLGYAFLAVAANSASIWVPAYFVRAQHMTATQIGGWISFGTIAGGLPGTLLGGFFADKFRKRGPGGRLFLMSILAFLCAPVWILLLNTSVVPIQFMSLTILLGLALAWLGPAAADVNDIAGPHSRGLAIGIYFFTVNLIGLGFGPPLYGKINDLLNVSMHPELMRQTLLLSPVACIIAGIILYIGSKKIEREHTAN